MEFRKLLEERHSVRKFRAEEIPEAQLQELLKMANSAPSAGNLQCFKIFAAKNAEKRNQISGACFGQSFVAQAPVVLVFCADVQASKRKYGEKGERLYALQDASIAAAYSQLAAIELGLGSCWVGAFEEKKLQEILATELMPVAVIPVGIPDQGLSKTLRKSLNEISKEV